MTQESVNTFIDLASSEGWTCTEIQEDEQHNIFELWEKDSDTELPYVKCTGQLQCGAEEAFEYILTSNLEVRQQWDPQVIKYDLVREIDANTHLLHYVYGAPFPVTTRDFSVIRHVDRRKGRHVLCARSVETEAIPVSCDCVRGEVFISGYLVEDAEKERLCTITTLNHVDPKGWIPAFVVNMAKNKQLTKLQKLSTMIPKTKEIRKHID